jgi:polyisoprenyl-phosphate glycosyltransferase
MYSIITPVYLNAGSICALIDDFKRISLIVANKFAEDTEFIFVVDASPDNSYFLLEKKLSGAPINAQLLLHSRNFGSFAAIRTGLKFARGNYFAVIAADLQDPPDILVDLLVPLIDSTHDIAVGVRQHRDDPPLTRWSAAVFWRLYRLIVMPEVPVGGVDIFACTKQVRDELLRLEEANSSLVGQIMWLGFRRKEVPYSRRRREHGQSTWTFRKKLVYLLDSVFSFSHLPIIALVMLGLLGILLSILLSTVIGIARISGIIAVPGYSATAILILFFGSLNMLGLGLVGTYAWRAYENTKRRPLGIVQAKQEFPTSALQIEKSQK